MTDVAPKPVVSEPVAAETAPAAPATTATSVAVEPTPAVPEPKVDDAKPDTTGEAPAPATTEEKVEEVKPVEPITSGVLGYKAPGLVKSLIFSKKHFWIGEEAVPIANLGSYLRGEKAEVAHPTAAWSSQTGKGLLYFAKHSEEKTPAGVLNLSEVSDLTKDGSSELFFKLHSGKHSLQAKTPAERDGWFISLEKAVEEAKTSAEGVKSSETYKETLEKLGKPSGAAAIGASTTPKKSTDVKPVDETERAGSASADEKKKEAKKSRSQSRKRASIFGGLIGKKEEKEEKEETKAEEKQDEEAKVIDPVPVVAETVVPTTDGPSETAPVVAPVVEEPKPAEPAVATEPVTETTEPNKPKPAKRSSVFGSFFEKVRSPTAEKKETDVTPAVPPKDDGAAAITTEAASPAVAAPTPAPAVTETAPVTEIKPDEAKPEEKKTPAKEKKEFSFGKLFGSKEKKTVSTEEAPVAAETAPKIEDAPAENAVPEPVLATKAEDAKADEPKTEESAPIEIKEKRRSSFFGNLTSSVKKEKKPEGEVAEAGKDEKHPSKLSGLFRNPSKAVKSKKDTPAVAKPEEAAEAKDETVVAPVAEEKKDASPETSSPPVIGDVVPNAVTVGQAQPNSTPTVQATAA